MKKESERINWHHYVGIFLLSLATLLLEVSLTRVLSVALWYHFGFLIISTALLGFGTSGVLLAVWRNLREEIPLDKALAVISLLFGVLTVVCFWLMQQIPFDPFSLFSDSRQLAFMPIYYIIISLTFFCSGLALALLLTRGGRQVNRLYAFDLIGAGLGCGALALVMPAFGGSGSVVVAAALGLLAAAIFGLRQTRKLALAGATLAIAFFGLAFFADRFLPISVTPNKAARERQPIYTEWNTFSKIDVYEPPLRPESQGRVTQPPPEEQRKAGRDKSLGAHFLMKKSPFTAEEIRRIEEYVRIGLPPKSGTGEPMERLYSPFEARPDSIYHQLLTAPDLRAIYETEPSQIEPATDDRPFFNQHTRWSSITGESFRDLFTQNRSGRWALEDRPVAEITLIILLVQAIVVAGILILLPLARFSRQGLNVPNRWRFLVYFAGLGLGFIMIEIALLQKFTLFLGQPVYTFAVVLAALLIFTGIGAALSEKINLSERRLIGMIVPFILLALALTAFLMPIIFSFALGWSLFWRVVLSIILLAPLGVLLGMPFPIGLRVVAEEAPSLVPWAWGVNGFFTVIGTVSALILGMAFGFKAVLVIASLCYLIGLAAMLTKRELMPKNIHVNLENSW